jgi:muconolactone delta-isomerase
MKFLVIVTPRPNPMIPPQVAARLLSAQREWMGQRLDDGTFECAYAFPTGGGCSVVNVDSHEALNALLLDSPSFPMAEIETRALADFNVVLGNASAMFENAASMMARA